MTVQKFQEIEARALKKLITCRMIAYQHATALKVSQSGKYLDLLALFRDQWHYITTHNLQKNTTVCG